MSSWYPADRRFLFEAFFIPIHWTITLVSNYRKVKLRNCRKTANAFLKPCGSVIIIKRFFAYQYWYESIYKAVFHVMPHPFVIMYDSTTVQRSSTSWFRQTISEMALISDPPAASEDYFNPEFDSTFNSVDFEVIVSIAGVFNVPHLNSKLLIRWTRIPFQTAE